MLGSWLQPERRWNLEEDLEESLMVKVKSPPKPFALKGLGEALST